MSSLLVTNKDNNYFECNNEVSSHKEMLCEFYFYPGAHTTALVSSLTVECGIGAAVSFSVTMLITVSLLE